MKEDDYQEEGKLGERARKRKGVRRKSTVEEALGEKYT